MVPANPKAGVYTVSARWLEGGETSQAGFIKVQPTSTLTVPSNARFVPLSQGLAVAHLGSLSTSPVCNDATVKVPVLWRGGNLINTNYTVFVQLRATAQISVVVSGDGPPHNQGLTYPTSVWSAGEFVSDTHTLDLAGKPAPGTYDVVVGLYDPASGARLPVAASASRTPDGGLNIAEITVAACS